MKIIKIILGIVAVIFVAIHLIEIPSKLDTIKGPVATSWWTGKVIAIGVGSLLAVSLFGSAKSGAE